MRAIYIPLALAVIAVGVSCKVVETTSEGTPSAQAPGAAAVGQPAPMLTVENSHNWDGDIPSLDELKGKVVVLDFWAFW